MSWVKIKMVFRKSFLILLLQLSGSLTAYAREVFDVQDEKIIAVTSFEYSNCLSMPLLFDRALSLDGVSRGRASLYCQSKGFRQARSFSTEGSVDPGMFLVYDSEKPEREMIHVIDLAEYVDARGTILTLSEKLKLPRDQQKAFRPSKEKTRIPYFFFTQIECEE